MHLWAAFRRSLCRCLRCFCRMLPSVLIAALEVACAVLTLFSVVLTVPLAVAFTAFLHSGCGLNHFLPLLSGLYQLRFCCLGNIGGRRNGFTAPWRICKPCCSRHILCSFLFCGFDSPTLLEIDYFIFCLTDILLRCLDCLLPLLIELVDTSSFTRFCTSILSQRISVAEFSVSVISLFRFSFIPT